MEGFKNSRFLVVGQMPPPVHGSNVMAELFIKSLRKIDCEVVLVEKSFSATASEVERFRIKKLFKIPFLGLKLFIAILRDKPSLCFYFNAVRTSGFLLDAFYLMIVRMLGVDYVLYIHGKGLISLSQSLIPGVRQVVQKTLSAALGVIVLGKRLKQDVAGLIQNHRLYILPNAIDDINRLEKDIEIRNDQNDKKVQVLYLSNLVPAKGPMEFLKMTRRVAAIDSGVRFVLAGPALSEGYARQLKNYIHASGLCDYVSMPGGVYGEEKSKLFESSDIFIFPSSYPLEAFPLVCLEAMQLGLPVVASPAGSIPDMIRDGLNGFITNPKDIENLSDCVMRLVRDETLRKRMGAEGRRIYENEYSIRAYERNLRNCVQHFRLLQTRS